MQRIRHRRRSWSLTATVLLAATLLSPQPAKAQELTAEDRAWLLSYLEQTRDQVAGLARAITSEQARFKTAPDRWSVMQVLEHLALTETFIMDLVRGGLTAEAPASPVADSVPVNGYLDRSQRFNAPEPLQPAESWSTVKGTLDAFLTRRAATIRYVMETNDLRARFGPHPAYGTLDAFQWILILPAHAERHLAQAHEVMRAKGFPRAP